MTILTQYNKILQGCGKEYDDKDLLNLVTICGDSYYKKKLLCPICSKAKEVFLERCQDELDFLLFIKDKGLSGFNQEQTKWRISQLKEVLQKNE